MKIDAFTIFLVLLGLLVILTLWMNMKDESKESFIGFQNQVGTSVTAGTSVTMVSYHPSKSVSAIYDNMYIDPQNGYLIEVFADPAKDGAPQTSSDVINGLAVVTRDAGEHIAITSKRTANGVTPYTSPQSKVTSIDPYWNSFIYTTSGNNTHMYQVIYTSWNKSTYLHMIDITSNDSSKKNIISVFMDPNGMMKTLNTFPSPSDTLHALTVSNTTFSINSNSIITPTSDAKYNNNQSTLIKMGGDTNNRVYFDISNGNVVIVNGTTNDLGIYKRTGESGGSPNSPPTFITPPIPTLTTSVIKPNNIQGVSIIVIAYLDNTLIHFVTTDPENPTKYFLKFSFRFNRNGYVIDAASDTLTSPTNSPMPSSTTMPNLSDSNKISNLTSSPSGDSNVCGDDISCKWFWYFNTIANKNEGTGSTYFSDDYFLKTEAVPPVCPQCPHCPTSGACSSCGGNGGCGTMTPTPANTSLPAGAITASTGIVYIPSTDASGNTRYVLYSGSGNKGSGSKTFGDRVSSFGNGLGDFAENVVDTTGDVAKSGIGLVKDAGSGAVGLVKDAEGLAKDAVTGGAGLAKDAITGGAGLAKDAITGGTGLVKDAVTGGAGLAKDAVTGGAGLAKDALTGGAGMVKDALTGGVGLAKDSVTGAAGFVKDAAGGIGGFVKDVGSGVGGFASNLGSGITHLGSGYGGGYGPGYAPGYGPGYGGTGIGGGWNPPVVVNNYETGFSGYSPIGQTPDSSFGSIPGQTPIDNYSNYGALQSKGDNYMPVTADFSAFRK